MFILFIVPRSWQWTFHLYQNNVIYWKCKDLLCYWHSVAGVNEKMNKCKNCIILWNTKRQGKRSSLKEREKSWDQPWKLFLLGLLIILPRTTLVETYLISTIFWTRPEFQDRKHRNKCYSLPRDAIRKLCDSKNNLGDILFAYGREYLTGKSCCIRPCRWLDCSALVYSQHV